MGSISRKLASPPAQCSPKHSGGSGLGEFSNSSAALGSWASQREAGRDPSSHTPPMTCSAHRREKMSFQGHYAHQASGHSSFTVAIQTGNDLGPLLQLVGG
jgi:hypothetical protein